MRLSESQLQIVQQKLELGNVTRETLRDDLIDHLCCDIEDHLSRGRTFDEAMITALNELAPKGLSEIQNETDFLLTSKYIPMKKLTYLIGLLSSMMMTSGYLMSVLHWPGAGSMNAPGIAPFGFIFFVGIFLPMLVITEFKRNISGIEKSRLVIGLISGLIAMFGVIFKVQHWPGANLLLLIGTLVFVLGFLPILFLNMYRRSLVS